MTLLPVQLSKLPPGVETVESENALHDESNLAQNVDYFFRCVGIRAGRYIGEKIDFDIVDN